MQSGGSGLPLYLQLPGINSQSRSRHRVLGSLHRGSNSKSLESANPEMPSPDEIDVLQKSTVGQLYDVIRDPPHEDYYQAPRVLVNVEGVMALLGEPLDVMTRNPKVALLHVYHLNEQLVGANQALSGMSVGGAFHVGVEVFGSEWAYGVYGLCCDLPRSETAHVYKCSIYLGPTPLDQLQVARVVHELCQQWKGAEYAIVGHNCCSFASAFCEKLCVGVLPAWVDRFSRILHGGHKFGSQIIEMAEKARPHIEQAAVTAGSISLQAAQVAAIHVQQGAQLLSARAHASWNSVTGSYFAAEAWSDVNMVDPPSLFPPMPGFSMWGSPAASPEVLPSSSPIWGSPQPTSNGPPWPEQMPVQVQQPVQMQQNLPQQQQPFLMHECVLQQVPTQLPQFAHMRQHLPEQMPMQIDLPVQTRNKPTTMQRQPTQNLCNQKSPSPVRKRNLKCRGHSKFAEWQVEEIKNLKKDALKRGKQGRGFPVKGQVTISEVQLRLGVGYERAHPVFQSL